MNIEAITDFFMTETVDRVSKFISKPNNHKADTVAPIQCLDSDFKSSIKDYLLNTMIIAFSALLNNNNNTFQYNKVYIKSYRLGATRII